MQDIRSFFGGGGSQKKGKPDGKGTRAEDKEGNVGVEEPPKKGQTRGTPKRTSKRGRQPPEKTAADDEEPAVKSKAGRRTRASRARPAKDQDEDEDFVVDNDEGGAPGGGGASGDEAGDSDDVAVVKRPTKRRRGPDRGGVKAENEPVPAPKQEAVVIGTHRVEAPPVFKREKAEPTVEPLWVDKYRPKTLSDLCANPKHAKDLSDWLRKWRSVHLVPHPPKWKPAPGQEKAALLSGPPGVGKTSLAHAVCRELNMEVQELNASDTRNKGAIAHMVGSLVLNEAIGKYLTFDGKKSHAGMAGQVLIMDEVDGMSSGDRGGMQELIQVIKRSRVPIICIANDDSDPKVRSLANHCLKLKFRRPMVSQVRRRLLAICEKESFSGMSPSAVEALAEASNGDIRQMINTLQVWHSRSGTLSREDVEKNLQDEGKTFQTQGIFDLFRAFFEKKLPVSERLDKYFMDPDLVPLMVQENYVNFAAAEDLDHLADAATAISDADLIGRVLREEGRWDLMPTTALLSSVLPGSIVASHMTGRPNFPMWFGKMSSERKYARLAQEIDMHMKTASNTEWRDLLLDYAPTLRSHLSLPLIRDGVGGIQPIIDLLDAYFLSREDWETVLDLTSVQAKSNPKDSIPTAVKTAFTRAYSAQDHALSTVSALKVKKSAGGPAPEPKADDDVIVEKDEAGDDAQEDDQDEDDGAVEDGLVTAGGPGKKRGKAPAKKSGRGRPRKQ